MICQIKTIWDFAVFPLVTGLLLASGGCFDASSSRAERNRESRSRDTLSHSDTSSRNDRTDRMSRPVESESGRPATDSIAVKSEPKVAPTETSTLSVMSFDQGASERQSLLPIMIDWRTPDEKLAQAAAKIAADSAGTVGAEWSSEAAVETVVEVPAPHEQEKPVIAIDISHPPEAEQAAQDASQHEDNNNPFAGIAESSNKVIPLPTTAETIDEGIWQQAQSLGHDSLGDLAIPKTDSAVTKPKAANDNTRQLSDAEWKAVESNSEPATTEPVASDNQVELAIEPVIDPAFVPALSNTQNDDSDPFGFGAAEAFDQFNQTIGGHTTQQTTTPQSTTPQDNNGINWDDTGGFGIGDDAPAPFDVTEPGENQAKPSQPAVRQPPQPQASPSSPSASGDDLAPVGRLTPVEEYIINEAKLSSVKLMESVELLYKLNKPLLARRLLRQLLDGELTADDCQQIGKRVNPAILLHISLDEEYQPEGARVVQKIVAGSQSYLESRTNLENAMQLLLAGTDRQKDDARRTVLNGGETSIEYLLERLAASSDQKELSAMMSLLMAMGESARRALQESLVTTTPLGMRAARLLTQMGRASDSRFLLPMMFDSRLSDEERREAADMVKKLSRNVPNQVKAAETLYSMASNYFRGKAPFMTDANNEVSFWMLKEGEELPVFITDGEDVASRYFAEKFARFATCLDPQKPTYRQLWLVAFLDLKGAEIGSDNLITLDEELLKAMLAGLTIDDVESALRFAMQQGKPIAARVAAELMGEFGDVEAVIYKRGSQSALVKAAGFSDRRVRFAALRSIIKLQPNRPYPGSSTVSQSLVYFTRATGKKRAVVVAPWLGEATSLASLLDPLGYTSESATTGRQAMQLAIHSADTELMMLDVRTPSSNVEFLIQDMRADNRTHDVPIAVLAAGWVISRAERANYGGNRMTVGDDEFLVDRDMMTRAERAAFGSKMAHAFPRPYDEASAKFVVDNLLRRSGVELVPQQIRLAEAKQSIQWVVALYQQSNIYRFENIEQIAWDTLWLPELTADTLPLVERIPTVNAQRWLTHIVSTPAFDIEIRKAALKAFEKNTHSYGVLIRGRQILDLYDLYNASGNEPVASQQARSDLLDVVERHADYMQKVNYRK